MAVTKALIANGTALSGVIDLRGQVLTGVQYPAAWTAADVTLQISPDNVLFGEAFIDPGTGVGTALSLDAAASQVSVLTGVYIGDCYIKLRSGTSGAPVNQGADRSLTLLTTPL